MTNTSFSRTTIQKTPSRTRSQDRVWDGVLDLCLPYCIGEVASARFWLMTEGSLYSDPSVLILGGAEARSTEQHSVLFCPTSQGRQKMPETGMDA
jgi:hypothetical protein